VHGDGIPSWFDDENPRAWRRKWLVKLRRPVAVVATIASAGALWLAGWQALAISVAGVVALVVGFVLGVSVLRKVLSGSHPVIGVARAIVEEAISTRLSILLVMLLVVSLPILPLLLDPSERLAYRVQFFLSWSLAGASVLLALLTIALCCTSVCGDIESRRIHMALSKPMGRWEYLFGKWLGVILLDLLLVSLVGIGVYACAFALARSPAADAADRLAIDEQVLTARASVQPVHPRGEEFEQSVATVIEAVRKDDPATFNKDPSRARKRIMAQEVHRWHTVSADTVSSFVFQGLDKQKIKAPVVQLRLEPWADNSNISEAEVRFVLWLNERPFPMKNGQHEPYTLSAGRLHTIDIPSAVISDSGSLKITVENKNLIMPGEEIPTSISFSPGEGLEILYRVGNFAGNFFRCLLVMWAKLVVLAAAALTAAAWLGFPTALLTGLMVYVTAVSSGFFADAVDIYTGFDRKDATLLAMVRLRARLLTERALGGEWWEVMKTVGAYFADAFVWVIPSFGEYDSIALLATGRLVGLGETATAVGWFAMAYPVLLLGLAWGLLENRDLARGAS
jgi:hypothetical protein